MIDEEGNWYPEPIDEYGFKKKPSEIDELYVDDEEPKNNKIYFYRSEGQDY